VESSESIKELTIALNKVQGQLQPALKNAENPYFKSRYADLVEVWVNCRKLLSENGFAVIQTLDETETGTLLETTLSHTSGEWIRGRMGIHPVKVDPQGIGSAITYARRYGLCAIVGITAEGEDDDAESALDRGKSSKAKIDKASSKEHWCAAHNVAFFKSAKMKSYAHPIKDSDQWCYEHKKVASSAPSPADLEQAVKSKEVEQEISPIDLGWLKEQLTFLQSKGLEAWTNRAIVAYLNTLTHLKANSIVEAVKQLSKPDAERFVEQINEAVKDSRRNKKRDLNFEREG